ncbi:DUF4339 domain-containing protein [Edaphobacter aggregans]|uniref:DUF4339 domain-containing protein n=1 Tax=Edaphobacter aggregans TaxID=570835 RepID=UPI0005548853|nr:DUF4339 domain-containing protein [Edaphobacter aggregans]
MPYHIAREGQTYGPYTLEDLQRYVASGNVLLTDLAKSDDSPDWVPVAQILNPAAGATAAVPISPDYTPPAAPYIQPAAYAASPYPDPPNLHWALVLLIGICTCGVFFVIWDLVQVLWVKRVQPQTKAMPYFIAYAIGSFLNVGASMGTSAAIMNGAHPTSSPVSALISLATLVLLILFRFAMKASLEQHFNGPEPLGLRLGPVMTFFFGGLYFQYHLNRLNEMKRAMAYRGY